MDTWSGQLNEFGGTLPDKMPVMLLGCASTVVTAGVGPNVSFRVGLTTEVAKVWSEPIDFLYIDADHSYEGVLADLDAWVPHVRSGGLILGDDYGNAIYPGVAMAWEEFADCTRIPLTTYQSDPPAAQGTQLVYGVVQ